MTLPTETRPLAAVHRDLLRAAVDRDGVLCANEVDSLQTHVFMSAAVPLDVLRSTHGDRAPCAGSTKSVGVALVNENAKLTHARPDVA